MVFAIMAMVGLVAVFVIEIVPIADQAEGVGCKTSQAANASKGKCIRP